MLDWKVLEDEALPPIQTPAPVPPWQRWWPWLLLWALLLATLLGIVWWRGHQQDQTLRADLQATINAETRLMALGTITDTQTIILNVADPNAPPSWMNQYWYQFAFKRNITEPPQLQTVAIQEDGTLALIDIRWPMPNVTDPTAREAIEQRAYRLVNSEWRRAPLPMEEEPKEEARTESFVLIAPPKDLALFATDPDLQLDLEGLRHHLRSNWPENWGLDSLLYINIQPDDVGFIVEWTSNRQTIVANSPRFVANQIDLASPLPLKAQYRFRLIAAVVQRLTAPPMPTEQFSPDNMYSFTTITDQLQQAEARHWTLTPAEQQALRNQWRESLNGEWESPFSDVVFRSIVNTPSQTAEREHRLRAISLTLDYLVETEGIAVLGQMARELDENRSTFATLCQSITGLSQQELETRVQEYALRSQQ